MRSWRDAATRASTSAGAPRRTWPFRSGKTRGMDPAHDVGEDVVALRSPVVVHRRAAGPGPGRGGGGGGGGGVGGGRGGRALGGGGGGWGGPHPPPPAPLLLSVFPGGEAPASMRQAKKPGQRARHCAQVQVGAAGGVRSIS